MEYLYQLTIDIGGNFPPCLIFLAAAERQQAGRKKGGKAGGGDHKSDKAKSSLGKELPKLDSHADANKTTTKMAEIFGTI
ncbi:MAG TPA: hypothetical protein VMV69_08740 [Pirellulales bacterium]|nr:hypothetical protein [Pirellulales bacterium]